MDPVTHAIIGMAVSAAGQGNFSVSSPITVAATLGSVIPDGDIILRAFGGSVYLKHHRGVSHSLIGIAVEAIILGLALHGFYPSASLLTLVLWSFVGALTHIISDILNSYGAKIFWPLSSKKKSLSLLTLTDPVVIIIAVSSILSSYYRWGYNGYLLIAFVLYLISKIAMRVWGVLLLKKKFNGGYEIQKIHLLPSMIAGHKFHYIIEEPLSKIVGEIDFIFNKVKIINIFKKHDLAGREYILESRTARYFRNFTPIFHVKLERFNGGHKALFTDLRYFLGGKFLHHATIIYDRDMNIIEERFNPYNINNSLNV